MLCWENREGTIGEFFVIKCGRTRTHTHTHTHMYAHIQVLSEVREDLVAELVEVIRESCPEYLCLDLTLTDVELTCTGQSDGLLTATATGIGTQDSVRSFVESISEGNEPLKLDVNGTAVELLSQMAETQSGRVAEVTGLSVGAGLGVLVLLLTLSLCCALWHWLVRLLLISCLLLSYIVCVLMSWVIMKLHSQRNGESPLCVYVCVFVSLSPHTQEEEEGSGQILSQVTHPHLLRLTQLSHSRPATTGSHTHSTKLSISPQKSWPL